MPLYLIGLGLTARPCISEEAYKWVSEADEVYLERYTSPLPYSLDDIKKILGRDRLEEIYRGELEENMDDLVDRAKDKSIAILVYGDPLIATTHKSIIISCVKKGVEYKIYHNISSYLYAISESGLDVYKFGCSATLVRGDLYLNRRSLEIAEENLDRGLHTLFFLEYSYEDGYMMTPIDALKILRRKRRLWRKILNVEGYIIVMANLGLENEMKLAFKPDEIPYKELEKVSGPSILILTGRLHYMEREYIEEVLKG